MKTKLRSLTTVLMAASILWFSILPCRAEDYVTISAAEFQRMVYSGHLMTQLDEKPELDACLQVLLELQRRNPNADPTALADVSRQALARYRTNAPNYIRTSGHQDEILAAYLEAFRQVPAHTDFVPANLSLLNQFLLRPQDYSIAKSNALTQSDLIHSGDQRLLASEREVGRRQVWVDTCTARARSSTAFAEAMEGLLFPETLISLAASPSEIIGNTNSPLHDSLTMETLLALSLTSANGSLTVSSNQLLNLFTNETQTLWETIHTNIALQAEFDQNHPDLPAFLTNQAAMDANAQHIAEVQEGQARTIATATAAIFIQSELIGAEPGHSDSSAKTREKITGIVEGVAKFAKGAGAWGKGNKVEGTFEMLAGSLAIFGVVSDSEGEPADARVMREIGNVKTLIGDLSHNVNARLNRVDQSLVTIFDTLNTNFDKIEISLDGLGQQITTLSDDVNQVNANLVDVQTDLHRLEREIHTYLTAGFRLDLVTKLNSSLGYESFHFGSPLSAPNYDDTRNYLSSWAIDSSRNGLQSPVLTNGFTDENFYTQLTSLPRESSLNYIRTFLTQRFPVTLLGPTPLANPRDWFVGAEAYLQLAAENPEQFRGYNSSPEISGMITVGQQLSDFFGSLTFLGTNINWPLYNELTGFYLGYLSPFLDQVQTSEDEYASANGIALDTWRQWNLAAPRVAATSTELVAVRQPLPPIPRDAATRIEAGYHQSLAVKTDGTVVGWGDNSVGQIAIPPGLSDVVEIAAGTYHCLAVKADGTVVSWGLNSVNVTDNPPSATNVANVAAGEYHSLALRQDGTVVGWGYNNYGQTDIPASATDVMKIAAGWYHSLALKTNGTVIAWGAGTNDTGSSFRYGQAIIPAGLTNVTEIGGGAYHSLALLSNGRVVAWGDNSAGQTNIPPSATNVISIAAGAFHNMALKADGTVVAWGNNGEGETKVPIGLRNVIEIAAGYYYSLALQADGTVVAWGDNSSRQCVVPPSLTWRGAIAVGLLGVTQAFNDARFPLDSVSIYNAKNHILSLKADGTVIGWGDNTYGQMDIPEDLSNVVAVAAGAYHDLALKADGTVVGWGGNDDGQISIPASATNVVAIAAGWRHSLALRGDGSVVAWGLNSDAQSSVPASAINVVAISAGGYHSLALKADGTVIGWGYNLDGRSTGAGTYVDPYTAAGTVTYLGQTLTNVVAIGAGFEHSIALRADGTVVGWGNNSSWQATHYSVSGVVAIAAGAYHNVGILAGGNIVEWGSLSGYNFTGQIGIAPSYATNVVAIAVGGAQSLALKADGTYAGWFDNFTGQELAPPSLTDVVAIASGANHNLALKADSTVFAWGDNTYGQTDTPATATNVFAIAAGPSQSLALLTNGTVVGWGNNQYGQVTGEPTVYPYASSGQVTVAGQTLSNVVAIAAGDYHSLALKSDGSVVGWGSFTPIPAEATNVVAIAAGKSFSLALKADGKMVGWGNGGPAIPASLSNVVAIAAVASHGLALQADRKVVGLGIAVPDDLTNVVALAAGKNHSLALKADGTVVGWGDNSYGQDNYYGQITIPASATNLVGIAAGDQYSLLLKSRSSSSAGQSLAFIRAQTPRRVGSLFQSVNTHLIATLQTDAANYSVGSALTGPKALLTAVLELGLPYTLERDDILHGFLYGDESLVDLNTSQAFLEAENAKLQAAPEATPQTLTEVAALRYQAFAQHLTQSLDTLERNGQPEIPRLVGHTMRQLNLLRDSWGTQPNDAPPSALEIGRRTNGLGLVLYGEPYARYSLQQSSSPNTGWTSTLITNLRSADSPLGNVSTNLPITGDPARYYRIAQPMP